MQELALGACRKTCQYLGLKGSKDCSATKLAQKMNLAPTLIRDKQGSSAHGAAHISLAVCLAQYPDMDLDLVTSGLPEGCDGNVFLHDCHGFDNRRAKCVDHKAYYDVYDLPEYAQERERLEAEAAAQDEDVGVEGEGAEARSSEHSPRACETSTSSAQKKTSDATESEKTASSPGGGDQ